MAHRHEKPYAATEYGNIIFFCIFGDDGIVSPRSKPQILIIFNGP